MKKRRSNIKIMPVISSSIGLQVFTCTLISLPFMSQIWSYRSLSPKGIEMRVNRSSQVEGAFGVIKQDMDYERARRRGMENVSLEFMLTCVGYNIRKLFRHFGGNLKMSYWTAPKDLKPEKFKKPSAKRLIKRVSKKNLRTMQKNRSPRQAHSIERGCSYLRLC